MSIPGGKEDVAYFLDLIKRSKKGKFKVYIGMSAGVGKSFRMLQEVHSLMKNNIRVQVGFIETHGRPETQALLEGLPLIPRKTVFYKGKELEEMDVPAIIKAGPEVVIVDELAHTNIPGSKNEKRWQDVLDLLDVGISVISAVNIQHIESLNGEIQKITGIEVQERVPDRVLKMADEVVNIDLTADELIARLKEGKIYEASKIATALSHFFRSEKILQLRELALREVASQVERKIESEVLSSSRARSEKFMACISSNDISAKRVIRKTARLASYYNSQWKVLYVQAPGEGPDKISLSKQRHLINNFKLATELGAEVIRMRHQRISQVIFDQAVQHHITTICIGKPQFSLLKSLLNHTIIDQLVIKLVGTDIDLIILS
jgi:two-component system sensor histidine kinase KdpD